MFKYLYPFRIHNPVPAPPKGQNRSQISAPSLGSGYCLHGEYYYDEKVMINQTVEGTIFHSLRLVIDNNAIQSTKVYLDDNLVGSVQEHFVPRLKGGVFVTHKLENVGLFKNFRISGCTEFSSGGNCLDGMNICLIKSKDYIGYKII